MLDKTDPKQWAVVCPGPSLRNVTNILYDEGGLICVNAAIQHAFGAAAPDYWAFMDPEVFHKCAQQVDLNLIADKTTIWTFYNLHHHGSNPRVTGWGGWGQETIAVFGRFKVMSFGHSLENELPFGNHIPWRAYTALVAIALAIQKGARRIRMYGADMHRQGYFCDGHVYKRTNHSNKRWQNERLWFEEAVKCCRDHGVEVSREIY